MSNEGDESGYCRRRGRPRMKRSLAGGQAGRCYTPKCTPDEQGEEIMLLPEEIAALDLLDLQGLDQEKAAAVLGVSRKTIWRDIHTARHKIADALVNGKAIRMEECARRLSGHCPKRDPGVCRRNGINSRNGSSAVPEIDHDGSA